MSVKAAFGSMDSELFDPKEHPNFAYFLAPPILLDSANFSPLLKGNKWSEEDVEILRWLQTFSSKIGDDLFNHLYGLRQDQKVALNLGLAANLVRDYKQYPIAGGKLLLGCSVLVFSPETMLATYGSEQCCAELESLMLKRGLHIYTQVCNVVTGDNQWSKHLLVYTADSQLMEHFCGVLRQSDRLKLGGETRAQKFMVHWECRDKTVTRKVFEQIVKTGF